jgi:hypothetical protein
MRNEMKSKKKVICTVKFYSDGTIDLNEHQCIHVYSMDRAEMLTIIDKFTFEYQGEELKPLFLKQSKKKK